MALAVGCGLLIALFYDLYWLCFAHKYRPRWLRVLEDLLFWLVVFCLTAAFWLYSTGGEMRLSIFLWLGLGMALWRAGLSRRLRLRRRRREPLPPVAKPREKI